MELEFHYHITYLIAARAGFTPDEAAVVATSCQFVDDNIHSLVIDGDNDALRYENYFSQTYDITKAKEQLLRIYCLFHFMPGDPQSPSAYRTDGLMHWLNTTPGSRNAVDMLDMALATDDPYRIGVACHVFADSYAHQNFVGYKSAFNSLKNPFSPLVPNIGHAEALDKPDLPGRVWEDTRLLAPQVANKTRFLDAARDLFTRLAAFRSPGMPGPDLDREIQALGRDLDQAMGGPDPKNKDLDRRIGRYKTLAHMPPYGGQAIPDYDPMAWFGQAVRVEVHGLPDDWFAWAPTILPDRYHWRDPATWRSSHWYRFQEAVKAHQGDMSDMLKERNLKGLSLPGW